MGNKMIDHTIYEYELHRIPHDEHKDYIEGQLKEAGFNLKQYYTYIYNPRDNCYEYSQE